MILIYRANSAKDKGQYIQEILERIQAVQLLMRLSHDMKILPRRHYAALSEMTENLAKQAQGATEPAVIEQPLLDFFNLCAYDLRYCSR